MHINSIQPVYFSPTRTSGKIVHAIAEGMNIPVNKEIDLTYPTVKQAITIRDTLPIIGVPTYAGRVAPTALERLKYLHGESTPAILVVLYGNRDYEDALLELSNFVKERGFVPIAGGAFIGEHSYSTAAMPTAGGRPDQSDIDIAKNFGKEVVARYAHLPSFQPLHVTGNFPYKEIKPKTPATPTTNDALCTRCEFCISICPVQIIKLENNHIVSDPETCIKCCACVKRCPFEAREFNTQFTQFLYANFHERKEPELFMPNV